MAKLVGRATTNAGSEKIGNHKNYVKLVELC